jgi:hypothetical protein
MKKNFNFRIFCPGKLSFKIEGIIKAGYQKKSYKNQ